MYKKYKCLMSVSILLCDTSSYNFIERISAVLYSYIVPISVLYIYIYHKHSLCSGEIETVFFD